MMVASSTKKKGRRGQQTSTEGAETPPPGASGSRPQTRGSAGQTPPPPAGRALTVPGQNPGGGSADPPPGVAQFEALVQALNTLPADTRRAISAHMGVPSATSAASQRYDEERMDNFYANCISPYIPEELRSEFDSVEWSDVGTLFSKVCHSLELRKAGEDVTGAKAHELGGVSLWTPDDAATLHRIVDHRDWQAKMLPRIAKPSGGRGRGNRTGRGRGRGGRRNDTRPSGGRSSEGRKDSESSTHAADAAAEPASATKATPRKTGPKKAGKGKGK